MTDPVFRSSSWREVAPQVGAPRRIGHPIAWIVPFAAAGLLFLWGRPLFGAVVAGIGVSLIVLRLAIPSVHDWILSKLTRFAQWVGKWVAVLLLTLIYAIVFTPIALIRRLLRIDTLQLRSLGSCASLWSSPMHVETARLFGRPFLLERSGDGRFGRRRTVRFVARLSSAIVILFLLNLAVGYALHAGKQALAPPDPRAQVSVYVEDDWASTYFQEFEEANVTRYEPFLGWVRKDYSGDLINIEGGLRRSYRPALASAPGPVLATFGGSTMWGTGARDEYTIPSFLARLAERDGVNLTVFNFGETGYVNYQGILRLLSLCADNRPPDIVVFYEGANDTAAKLQHPDLARSHQNLADWRARHTKVGAGRTILAALESHSLVHIVGRRLGHTLSRDSPRPPLSEPESRHLAAGVVDTYEENAALVEKLARVYDFEAWFFWQPVVYTKKNLTAEEQRFGTTFGEELATVYREATVEIRKRRFAVDLSDIFDDVNRTVFIDWAHVGESGNERIAKAIYERLRPSLLGSAAAQR